MNPRIRYWLLLCWLWPAVLAHAQYNPSNPPEPAVYFTLTLQATPDKACTFNVSTPAVYEVGQTIRLKATAATNFKFVAWEENNAVVSTSAQFDYTMPERNVTLTAHLEYSPSSPSEPPVPQPDTATTSILYLSCSPAEGGSINVDSGKEYAIGASVTLKATAKTNFTFVNWTCEDEVIATTAQFSYTVRKRDNNLVAHFTYSPSSPSEPPVIVPSYTLTVERTPTEGGTVNTSGGSYAKDAVIDLVATPKSGYRFLYWTQDDEVLSESASFTYVMPARAVTITATFEKIYNPSNPSEPSTCLLGSGACGSNLTWELTCDHVLIIRGSGAMNDYGISKSIVPWNEHKHLIHTVILPDGLTSIGKLAFGSFARLKEIHIPGHVTQIGDSAFLRCRRLAAIYCKTETPPCIGVNTFELVNRLIPLVVPRNAAGTYRSTVVWDEFPNIHEEPYTPSVVNVLGAEVVVIESNDTLTTVYSEVDIFDNSTMVYHTVENTLTLNSLSLESDDSLSTAISYSGSEPLTIVLNESSTIFADTVIASSADIVIKGEGSLVAEGLTPICGVSTASITFDSVNMHVRSMPPAAAGARHRVRNGKLLDETGGPALSGFGSADFNKTNVSPPDAMYGSIVTADNNGEPMTINALYVSGYDGTPVILTEFTLTPVVDYITATDEIHEPQTLDPQLPMYNILGIPVSIGYKGIIIQNGHTYIVQ